MYDDLPVYFWDSSSESARRKMLYSNTKESNSLGTPKKFEKNHIGEQNVYSPVNELFHSIAHLVLRTTCIFNGTFS